MSTSQPNVSGAVAVPTVGDLTTWIEQRAHPCWAEEWDNVGLQLGRREQPVRLALVALELTSEVAQECRQAEADLLIVHHSPIFRPLPSLADEHPGVGALLQLAAARVALYAAHTNLDVAPEIGTNVALARTLGLAQLQSIGEVGERGEAKVVTFAPPEQLAAVRNAMVQAGAGVIGDYAECSYELTGRGGFVPLPGADPFVGEVGRREEVEEVRLEMVCPRTSIAAVVAALVAAHPYEEPAFDVYGLLARPTGAGRAQRGTLPQAMTVAGLVGLVGERLTVRDDARSPVVPTVRTTGPAQRVVGTVAVCGGSGGKLLDEVHAAGAEVHVTGEVGHHEALRATELGLTLIEAGHWATEWPVVPALASALQEAFAQVEVRCSRCCTDPWERQCRTMNGE
jgi:dinuclear metal center YbgI/SA1388 family protein